MCEQTVKLFDSNNLNDKLKLKVDVIQSDLDRLHALEPEYREIEKNHWVACHFAGKADSAS